MYQRQLDMLAKQRGDGIEVTNEVSKDCYEGLNRMLLSLHGDTTNNVLSATMTRKLVDSNSLMSSLLYHKIIFYNG